MTLGHRHLPVGAVGAYVPGGRYPMLASSFMTVAVAKVAGVAARDGVRAARAAGAVPTRRCCTRSRRSGADRILCLGGVQALAALAFGLCGAEPVDMLVGPGNAYVAEAKRQLFGTVGIDLLGRADRDRGDRRRRRRRRARRGRPARPGRARADVARAADRDVASGSRGRCWQPSTTLLETWPTREVAGVAWRDHGTIAVVADDEAAMRLADSYAPEHLEVQVAEHKLDAYLAGLRCYGALFLGAEATVAYGDKAIGTNHVLPTMGAARFTGGLWVGLVPAHVHVPARHAGRARAPSRPRSPRSRTPKGFAGHARTAELRLAEAERA